MPHENVQEDDDGDDDLDDDFYTLSQEEFEQIQLMSKQRQQYRSEMEHYKEQAQELKQTMSDTTKAKSKLLMKTTVLQRQVDVLETQLQRAQEHSTQLQLELKDQKHNNDTQAKYILEMESHVSHASNTHSTLVHKHANLQTEMNVLTSELQQCHAEQQEHKKTIMKLTIQECKTKRLQRELMECQVELKSQCKQICAQKTKLQVLLDKNTALEAAMKSAFLQEQQHAQAAYRTDMPIAPPLPDDDSEQVCQGEVLLEDMGVQTDCQNLLRCQSSTSSSLVVVAAETTTPAAMVEMARGCMTVSRESQTIVCQMLDMETQTQTIVPRRKEQSELVKEPEKSVGSHDLSLRIVIMCGVTMIISMATAIIQSI